MHSLCSRTKQYISNVSRKSTNSSHKLALASIVTASAFAISLFSSAPSAYAATTPDSCFAFNGNGTITRYYNNEGNNSSNPACPRDVEIPSQIGGVAVTGIGYSAFQSNQLTSFTIPGSVTSIRSTAFANNQLTSVIIPNTVTTIGDSAFINNQLTSVTIPDSVTSIDETAFSENQLTSIVIPNSITNIGVGAFSENQLTSVVIPESVVEIGAVAFAYNKFTSISISGTVKLIGERAFLGNLLQSITLSEGTEYINDEAFAYNKLTTVNIPASVKVLGGYTTYDSGNFNVAGTENQSAFYGQSDYDYAGHAINNLILNGTDCSNQDDITQDYYGGGNQTHKQLCEGLVGANFWYTRLTLTDSSNPNGFVDTANVVSYFDNHVLGGHLISTAQA